MAGWSQAWNDAFEGGASVEVAGITVTLVGVERVDHTWVSTSYGSNIPAIEKDTRREVRTVLQTKPCILQLTSLDPGDRCQWDLRIELPEDLPPTFKGVAVRYAYHFNVSARVMEPGVKLGNSEESSSDGRASPTASEAPSTSSRGALSQSLGPASQDLLPRPSSLGSLFFRGPARPNNSTVGRLLTSAESYAWREVNLRVPVHIWPPEGLFGNWKVGIVMGDEARVAPITYSLVSPAEPSITIHAQVALAHQSYSPAQHLIPLGGHTRHPGVQEVRESDRLSRTGADGSGGGSARLGEAMEAAVGGDGGPGLLQGHAGGRTSTASSPRSGISVRDEVFEPTHEQGLPLRRANSSGSPARNAGAGAKEAAWIAAGEARPSSSRTSPSPTTPFDGSLRSYNLRVGSEVLVALALHAPLDGSVELGSTLAGTLDMRKGHRGKDDGSAGLQPRCVQVVVTLETEEVIQPGFQSTAFSRSGQSGIRKVYDEQVEVTQDIVLSHFMFSVPFDAPPSFATQLVSLQWLLRFEFTAAFPGQTSGWLVGATPPEKVTWSLPFLVRPPSA